MGDEGVGRRLDASNRFLHAAVRAIAAGGRMPAAPDDWTWMERAREHGVLDLLAAHLADGRAGSPFPLIRRIRAVNHLRTVADLRKLDSGFAAAGVEWLVFKGPVLSECVYQRPGARGYGDLDILVRPRDVPVAADLLERMGATTVDGGWRAMQSIGDGESAYQLPGGTVVDLHWDVINDRRIRPVFAIGPETLFSRAREVSIGGTAVRTLDPVDTLLHLALHACHSGGDRLRWLLDIQQSVLRCDAPPGEVFDRALELRLDLVLRVMLNRVGRFLEHHPLAVGVPAPTLLERSWLGLDAMMMEYFPPGSRQQGRFSGAIVSDCTRARPAQSWRRLVGDLTRRSVVMGQRREVTEPAPTASSQTVTKRTMVGGM